MTIADSLVWWMTRSVPVEAWAWVELLVGAYVFAMTLWQRFNYWLYKDDGSPTKRLAQTAGVIKASGAAFVLADSLMAPTMPKPIAIILLIGIAADQTASYFAQRRIDCARAEGRVVGQI